MITRERRFIRPERRVHDHVEREDIHQALYGSLRTTMFFWMGRWETGLPWASVRVKQREQGLLGNVSIIRSDRHRFSEQSQGFKNKDHRLIRLHQVV